MSADRSVLDRLEKAALDAQNARGVDLQIDREAMGYPRLLGIGASAGQLSLREADAWRELWQCAAPPVIAALVAAARAAAEVSDVECDEVPPAEVCPGCDWCRLRTALEPLLSEARDG